ncbi:MAG: hypothetical protein KME60_21060 [Cyanomargarita calcarea GSE-NOS-MK-12-04C]|jgi:hypothetical protein|uniref:STAS domain-containing protein n=1 Tax=Cyanomargarita calcarea GSE-NOS-MK-12-04C TaxID=2839659 RepID=A0A951QPR2_9CYAN|nr:hypothetical protein [Cyanomargarita calcarea GSE-NOS-MK-12-04C]
MELLGNNYKVLYDKGSETVTFNGSLRLNGTEEYAPILQLLRDVIEGNPSRITLNFMHLNTLNSSGISMLSKFIIEMRKKTIHLMILGSNNIPWQGQALKNLQRLMPALHLQIL